MLGREPGRALLVVPEPGLAHRLLELDDSRAADCRSGSKVITNPGELGPDLLEGAPDRGAISHCAPDDPPHVPGAALASEASERRAGQCSCARPSAARAASRRPARPGGAEPGSARREPRRPGAWRQAPWHFLYFLPDPQGQGSLRPTRSSSSDDCAGAADSGRGRASRPRPPLPPAALIASAPASDSCS